jgi:simple sugar transport system ATP-binding protein
MAPLVELQKITKVYPNGVAANQSVDFSVEKGEIHALVGENGAGKSTLMKILYGMEQPSHGSIQVDGRKVHFHSPLDAIAVGIGMVHQNFMLIPSFSVAENIVLGQEPTRRSLIDKQQAIRITEQLSAESGLQVDASATVDSINVGMRQRVEILKTLYRGAQILILDEPTAVLTPQETDELFEAVHTLVQQGKTVIFITHKLREVKEISDRVTVMRGGRLVGTLPTDQASEEELARMMVGRDVLLDLDFPTGHRGPVTLRVEDLTYISPSGHAALRGVSFNVHSGEILGVAGVEGNGQTELVEVLTGLRTATTGTAFVSGANIINQSPRQVRLAGVAHIPEDRLTNGLALGASINENLIIDRYFKPPLLNKFFISQKEVACQAEALIQEYDIRTPSGRSSAASLSGGNMQKVIVARELSAEPKVLIAAQPTRGVDVGATEFVRIQLAARRAAGAAILLVSADLNEVMSLSDRIIVLFDGVLTGVFLDPARVTEQELGLYMAGTKRQTPAEMAGLL